MSACAALRHDVAEDTNLTIEELEREFPRKVTEALTKISETLNYGILDGLN